ncbi:alpha/beta hydrolase [Amycolatopsis mediterranei]|uniref:alpha/beta fold hydrolase n=1 Tax=Amycolatopsis mediterranei TaxID=33910 RepID=UPI00341CCBE5
MAIPSGPAGWQGVPRALEGTQKRPGQVDFAAGVRRPAQGHPPLGPGRPSDLSGIRRPVLVANGDHDRMVPTKNSHDLARRLPDTELVIYPDAGHGGIFQFHDHFVAKTLEFLER